jgi:hypothetical protein
MSESNLYSRADGNPPIRDTIRNLAIAQLKTHQQGELYSFFSVFSKLADSEHRNLLPKALADALSAAFDSDLIVHREVPFIVPGGAPTDPALRKKLDVLIVPSDVTPDAGCAAIEIKATMEFNPMAAALVELVLLTYPDPIEFTIGGKNRSFPRAKVKCMTLCCNENQDMGRLSRCLDLRLWPHQPGTLTHHALFLPHPNNTASCASKTHGVQELLAAIKLACCSPLAVKAPPDPTLGARAA